MSEANEIYLVSADWVMPNVSGPVHAALLTQAELSATGTRFEVTNDDETGSVSTVDLSGCNPWKLLAEIRELTLDSELTDGDTFLAICGALDAAGLSA